MRSNFSKVNNIFKIVAILLVIAMNIWIYIITKNNKVAIILGVFSVVLIAGIFFYERIYIKHTEDMLIELSDMLTNSIDMKDEEVFSTREDTLFSKLQHQSLKLTGILKEKNKLVEEEKNMIKELISDIAHQLKTPLTNMKMYEEFLQDENLSIEERKEFNEIILISIDRLTFLIESMIKMSRLESGIIKLKEEKHNLKDTILLAIVEIQKKAKNKNIEIRLEEVNKAIINYDNNWIKEAIFNILENAVKYTGENGEINITIESYEMFSRVDIKDNGIGIKEDELPKIFKRFYRGENARDTEGIGIGLYLTRKIVSEHNGYIKVDSNPYGSTFSVFLPTR